MIRSGLCRAFSNVRFISPVFTQFTSGLSTKNEKLALNEVKSADFGSLKRTQDTYLRSEDIPEDDDGYDKLEVIRKKRDKFYHRNKLTELIHSTPVRLQEALQVFDEMLRVDRRSPESTHFTLLITGCAKVGYTEKAFELFDFLLKYEYNPTKATITSLFNACAECRNREFGISKANFLRDWIFQNSYVCNAKQYNSMIKAYSKLGDMKTAFEIMKQMVEEGQTITAETFNMLLMGCISDSNSGLLVAIKIIKQMISLKCPLNIYTYNLLLRSVRDCKLGSQQNLNDFFVKWTADTSRDLKSRNEFLNTVECTNEDMKKLPFKVTYSNNEFSTSQGKEITTIKSPNLLSTAVSLAGQVVSINFEVLEEAPSRLQLLGGCEGILDHMKSNNVVPTIATFSLLLESSYNTVEEETKLVSLLHEYKVKLKTDFFNQIIKRRSMRADISGALNCLLQMQALCLIPDVVTFGVLAMGCQTKDLGLRLIEDMENAGFSLNIETIGALFKNACVKRDFDYILTLMHTVSTKKIAINSRVVEHLTFARDKVRDILLQHEKYGKPLPRKFISEEFQETFRKFNLEFKKWLKTVNFECSEDEKLQHNFELSKTPRLGMSLYEKSMRRKISDRVKKEMNSL